MDARDNCVTIMRVSCIVEYMEEVQMNTVAKNIKRLRVQNNLTQEDLADKMHVTRQTVSNWETEKNQPDIETLITLASIFGTDINEIIYGNKKNEYPKYQKKYIKDVIISLSIIAIVIAIRLVVIHYVMGSQVLTFYYGFKLLLVKCVSMGAIYFAIGFCVLSVFSLWFDCSIRKSKLCLVVTIICVMPILLLLCEPLCMKFISIQIPLSFWGFILSYQWVQPIFTQLLPAVGGVSAFLLHNKKVYKLGVGDRK